MQSIYCKYNLHCIVVILEVTVQVCIKFIYVEIQPCVMIIVLDVKPLEPLHIKVCH